MKLSEELVEERRRMKVYFTAEQIEDGLAGMERTPAGNRTGWPETLGDAIVKAAAEALAYQLRGGTIEYEQELPRGLTR